jgi:phage-related protein
MNVIITRLDGTTYSLADYGIKTLDFAVDAPTPRTITEELDGRDGLIELGTTYDARKIRASFYFRAYDSPDFPLLRNEIFRMFASRESFYVTDDRESGKRWLVKSGGFSVEQLMANKGRFDVEFTALMPFAESVGTTLDPFTFDSELWQIGQGLEADDLNYVHTTSSFRIFNAGDIAIDPRVLPLTITFTGASTNLTITNTTTGDMWQYTGTTQVGDTITLDGVRSLKNGASIFVSTNRKLITIVPGWNDFTITGSSGSFTISFDFRFYYL